MATFKCNEQAFYYWIMQYSEHFVVVKPESIIEKIKKSAEKLIETYNSIVPLPEGTKMLLSWAWCAASVSAWA